MDPYGSLRSPMEPYGGFICWALLGPFICRALLGPFICWALLGPFIWALLGPFIWNMFWRVDTFLMKNDIWGYFYLKGRF